MSAPALLTLIVAGPGLLGLGLWTLRTRAWYDGVPAAELLIDRAAGVAPPPRDPSDRRFNLFHAGVSIIPGTFFTACLVAAVIASHSE